MDGIVPILLICLFSSLAFGCAGFYAGSKVKLYILKHSDSIVPASPDTYKDEPASWLTPDMERQINEEYEKNSKKEV
jgi:hypothetical protein